MCRYRTTDLCVCGGFSEWQKIQALASSHGVLTVPMCGAPALPWRPHFTRSPRPADAHTDNPVPIQNEPVIEYDRQPNALRDDLLIETIDFEDGCLVVPDKPGLGVTVNEDVIAKYVSDY